MTTFTVELDGPNYPSGDTEAELQITHFHPGTPATRHDPGDGAEVSLALFVTILVNGEPVGVMPYDVLVLEYASANHPGPVALSLGMPRMTMARAEEEIEGLAIEAMASYDDGPDDYGEDAYERRMECAGERTWA